VRAKVTERRKEEAAGVRLEDAEVVVCGGRGMGSPDAFKELEDLAGMMGGAVGATRAACDLGWYPVPQQIGLTGKIVSPTLYFAIALSGASQHMAGVSGAKTPRPTSFASAATGSWPTGRPCCPPSKRRYASSRHSSQQPYSG
jgi:electron transfer flavoprotein alpha subunit